MDQTTRRDFLGNATRTAAAAGLGAVAAVASRAGQGTVPTGDRIRVALIGSGGQGKSDLRGAAPLQAKHYLEDGMPDLLY